MAVDLSNKTRKIVTMPHDLLQQVEDFRFANRISTEAEALRVLIRAGIDALKNAPEPAPAAVKQRKRK